MTTTYTSYRLITADLTKSLERVSAQPDVARETEYYLSKIGSIKTLDDFFADSRLYNYAMKAHGLEDMAYAKAFMRKVLAEGIDSDDAFANKLADGRYKALVESLNFARHGEAATAFERAQKGVAEKYTRQTLEQKAGEENTGVRLALYFQRMAPTIANGYEIIADEALSSVVRTVLQLPAEFAAADVDRQADAYEAAIDFKDFQDPQKIAEFLDRFTALWEIDNSSDGYDPLAVFGASSGYGISPDLLLTINNLKLGGR
ncbi:DUF1217 domain-containing protein [Sinorhizobium meliloti WSM1022]|uniref:DUF1217 domain-containing protein n=3 Tax=Rhizobium meliloti TaxID=382 RepID=Q92S00_RHIME|nr:DUF1217 domain-containing protein [Sinorhizobium meliloti]TWA89430.1 uncharacterized protein DUF1217 [Ensifer sp. SEMIA 134]TWB25547.1 uncharacterized protein DUF1217 [Ensifer sp. SEMIA 135]AEG52115.1 protein of unknown function DUF1217 [Sinorhizobium meliloti AK83]AGG73235.1 hypothetical protein SM2011_c03023 [Sinorhizobium meliloti 2011]AIL98481.1 flagellar basal-body rod protein FlgF [Sinorhizobium meliloti]